MKTCQVEECTAEGPYVRGWCRRHYSRWALTGDPTKTKGTPHGLTASELMERKGWTVTDEGCWRYLGSINYAGYGTLRWKTQNTFAHRVAYLAWRGEIPEDMLVRHRCDNRYCVNPDHLELGTQVDNMRDMRERGRGGSNKLTEDDVRAIRQARANKTHTLKELGEIYGVSFSTIHCIDKRKTWQYV